MSVVMATSCSEEKKEEKKVTFPLPTETHDLIQPVMLNDDSTIIDLSDYFMNPYKIKSLTFSKCLIPGKLEAGKALTLNYSGEPVPPVMVTRAWFGDTAYSFIMKRSPKVEYNLQYKPTREVKSVFVAGDFNGWSATQTPLNFKDGIWKADLKLYPGRFSYRIVVDGDWILDPANKDTVSNNMGGVNSVLTVGDVQNENAPKLWLHSTDGNTILVSYDKKPDQIFVLWDNYQLVNRLVIIDEDNKLIRFPIPENATQVDRSFMRVFSFNASGASNDLMIPLKGQQVVKTAADLNRKDYEASILYFLLVDRFNNGDKSIDKPINDPEVHERANYHGGDIKGILDKLKSGYFKELGINTIWLSPIAQNPEKAYKEYPKPNRKFSGYHGYWPISSTEIDYRFGNEAVFTELINEAHNQNVNVILDYVANHVHENHPIIKANPSWATNMMLPDGTPNIRIWDAQRLTTWFDSFLPTLDYSKPEVVDTMTSFAVQWIRKYNLDGFRHDATKHIPEVFWRSLTKKLKKEVIFPQNNRLLQIGETFGSRELIGSYVGSGMLDAQFDFNLYFDARSVFAIDKEPFTKLETSLKESFLFYGNHHLMGNVTGNHDIARFISYASGALSFEEDDKEAGWSRDIKVENPIGYAKLKMLDAFIMTIPGIPVIYYGDEIGMPGANDPDNRRMMKFDNLTNDEKGVKEMVKKLTEFRKNNLALTYGDFQTLLVTDKQYAFVRKYFDNVVVVVFNKSEKTEKVEITLSETFVGDNATALFGTKISKSDNKINLSLSKYSFEIITIK